jgi:hypothetical protein
MNSNKSSFCQMEFGVGRLKLVEQVVFSLQIREASLNHTPSEFRLEREKGEK